MKVSLVVTDLDGSLLQDHKYICDEDLATIDRLNQLGIDVAFATGRLFPTCIGFLDQHSLHDKVKYLIHSGGISTYHTKEKTHDVGTYLQPDELLGIYNEYKDYDISIFFVENSAYVSNRHSAVLEGLAKRANVEYIIESNFKSKLMIPRDKLVFCGDSKDFMDILEKIRAIDDPRCEFFRSEATLIDINAKGVSKATALENLCENHGYKMEEILAFGDNHNDYTMLAIAGRSACPDYSDDHVKSVVDFIVPSTDEARFTNFVKNYIKL